jgi:hypothetical protein
MKFGLLTGRDTDPRRMILIVWAEITWGLFGYLSIYVDWAGLDVFES